MVGLHDYKFVDTRALDSYIEQISALEIESRSRTGKLAVSLTGPSADYTTSSRFRPKTTSEKIQELVGHLQKNRLLGNARPKFMSGHKNGTPPFISEKTLARKVILPAKLLEDTSGIKQLAVWISDPAPEHLVPEKSGWDFPGSFLYLTEAHFDGVSLQTVFSGCSALQAIDNATKGRSLLDCGNAHGEPLGRDSYLHPVEKLRAIGGLVTDTRQIECLYRIRYITNEQCFSQDEVEYRVNDILGYPIYISQALALQTPE